MSSTSADGAHEHEQRRPDLAHDPLLQPDQLDAPAGVAAGILPPRAAGRSSPAPPARAGRGARREPADRPGGSRCGGPGWCRSGAAPRCPPPRAATSPRAPTPTMVYGNAAERDPAARRRRAARRTPAASSPRSAPPPARRRASSSSRKSRPTGIGHAEHAEVVRGDQRPAHHFGLAGPRHRELRRWPRPPCRSNDARCRRQSRKSGRDASPARWRRGSPRS